MKPTKQVINKFKTQPIEVRLWNGCFNRATVEVKQSRYNYILSVEVTHPHLVWQCGDKNSVELVYWKSCTGTHIEIPPELHDLIAEMKVRATMQDDEAARISAENRASFNQAMQDMGFK